MYGIVYVEVPNGSSQCTTLTHMETSHCDVLSKYEGCCEHDAILINWVSTQRNDEI